MALAGPRPPNWRYLIRSPARKDYRILTALQAEPIVNLNITVRGTLARFLLPVFREFGTNGGLSR